MNRKLSAAIFSSVWAIELHSANGYIPFIASLINGDKTPLEKIIDEERNSKMAFAIDALSGERTTLKDAKSGSVAIIPVNGPMMKEDTPCAFGTASMGSFIKQAEANPNIKGIVLHIDSPGGTVAGNETFSNTIKNSSKPIVTFVDGMMASAAYWAGSSAKEIISSSKTDMIGSIGTMISFADMKPAFEKMGVKFHEIYASDSTEKNKAFRDALEGNYETLQKEILDPSNKIFTDAVKSNRSEKLNAADKNILKGKVYVGEDALKAGLIDGFGTIETAIQRVHELAGTEKPNQTENKMKFKATWTAISAFLLSAFATEAKENETEITAEHLEKMNAELEAGAKAKADLLQAQNDLQAIKDANAIGEGKLTAIHAELGIDAAVDAVESVKTLKNEIADLKKKLPGATEENPVKETTEGVENKMKDVVDEDSEHMKTAEKLKL